jgi:putative acetyltransferase
MPRNDTDHYGGAVLQVSPVAVHDPGVPELIEALTLELADGGYSDEETFGYSAEQLESSGVHLVGARLDGVLVGIGGVEVQADPGTGRVAELKRMYVDPGCRGRGVADAVMSALVEHAVAHGAHTLRLETGDKQHAAIGFYARHGFVVVDRFPPYVDSATSVCMARAL